MSFLSGGSSPKEQEPTEQEKELAAQGVEKYNRYQEQYAPLEEAAISNISRPTENLTQGRTNADLMQEATKTATQSIESGNVSQGLSSLEGLTRGLAKANSANSVNAIVSDRTAKDTRALSAIETGLGVSARQQQGLIRAASTKNKQALNELQNEMATDASAMQRDASILGSISGAGKRSYDDYREQKFVDSLYR